MSAKLLKSLDAGVVMVKNRTSSAVSVNIPPKRGESKTKSKTHRIPGGAKKYQLTEFLSVDEIRRSNIKMLVTKRFLDIV